MTGQAGTSALAPAEIMTRFIAYIIDAIILGITYTVLISAVVVAAVLQGDTSIIAAASRSILFAVASFLYFGYTWTTWRASPGQRVLGLMTVNASDGGAMTWNQSVVRWGYLFGPSVLESLFGNSDQIGPVLSLIVGIAVLVYYIYLYRTMAGDPRRQGFHDKQAGTVVVKATA